jgi:hypothetical protein
VREHWGHLSEQRLTPVRRPRKLETGADFESAGPGGVMQLGSLVVYLKQPRSQLLLFLVDMFLLCKNSQG